MLASNLKKLREKKRMSKAAFANFLEIPYTTYNGYETGDRQPNYEILQKISNKLGVSSDWLLYGKKSFAFSDHKEDITPEEAIKRIQEIGKQAQEIYAILPADLLTATAQYVTETSFIAKESILLHYYNQLNAEGKDKVNCYAEDLTKIEKYTKNN